MLPLGGWRLQCLMAFRRSGCRDQIPGSLLFLTFYARTPTRPHVESVPKERRPSRQNWVEGRAGSEGRRNFFWSTA